VLLIALLGWQFGLAELVGGPIMIILLVLLYRVALSPSAERAALDQAKRDLPGAMEGHAHMSMMEQKGSWRDRLLSSQSSVSISHGFVMNWAMLSHTFMWKLSFAGVVSRVL